MVSSSARGTAGLDQGNVVSVCRRALTVCHILRYRGLARHRIGKAPIMCYHWTHDMNLTGLHFLLTYQCTFQCDHCFVWGSPRQRGTMTLPAATANSSSQAAEAGTIKTVAFEGGEPFLYYATSCFSRGRRWRARMGFQFGEPRLKCLLGDGRGGRCGHWLRPFAGVSGISSISVSSDLYHFDEQLSRQARRNALAKPRSNWAS